MPAPSRICTSGVGKDMGSIRDIAPLTTTASSRKRTIDTVSKKFRSILRVAGHLKGGTLSGQPFAVSAWVVGHRVFFVRGAPFLHEPVHAEPPLQGDGRALRGMKNDDQIGRASCRERVGQYV